MRKVRYTRSSSERDRGRMEVSLRYKTLVGTSQQTQQAQRDAQPWLAE
jgi:hypothetical protein